MGTKIIVYDVSIPHFQDNRILDATFASAYPGASIIPKVKELAEKQGWRMMTGDVFLRERPSFDCAVCWSNEATPRLKPLLQQGVEAVVLSSGESPCVAWKFYHELSSRSSIFRHACLFHGMRERSSARYFHQFYWPCSGTQMGEGKPWDQRKLLCMVISSNARVNWANWKSRCILPIRRIQVKMRGWIDPFLVVNELYETRLAAIEQFAGKNEFYLFGKGWDIALRYWRRIRNLTFANAPKACSDKIETMEGFKFAVCFENCVFPGYITEKIFDCFFAGCVPVYGGSPDITDFVSPACFIDYRDFTSFEELWKFLKSMTIAGWEEYRRNIRDYLASEMFSPFKDSVVAGKIIQRLTE